MTKTARTMHKPVHHSFALLLLCFCTHVHAQLKDFRIGTSDSIYSATLGETRQFWIHVPPSYYDSAFTLQHYPVLYLLDPEAHFYYTVGLVNELSIYTGNLAIPEMIVVGITTPQRTRDVTPTHMAYDKILKDSNWVRSSGGGEKFLQFMRSELMPHIEKNFRTLPNRTFAGHSLTALLVVHTLLHHPDLFDNYLAIDPSLWWDDRKLAKESAMLLKDPDRYRNKSLYIAAANTLFSGKLPESARTDTTMSAHMMGPMLMLNDQIEAHKSNGLRYRFKFYQHDDHTLVPISGIHEGLRFLYDFYDFRLPAEEIINFNMSGVQKLEKHFQQVEKRFGFDYKIPERVWEMYIGMAFYGKHIPETEYLAQQYIKNYPGSHNAHFIQGYLYASGGETEKAREYYTRALAIREVKATRDELEKLSGIKP